MSRLIAIVLVLIIGWVVLFKPSLIDQYFFYSVCDQPVRYRVDTVDSRFKITKEQFIKDVGVAASWWNQAYGKELFVYDPTGDLSINLIFDQRQSLDNQIVDLEKDLQKGQTDLETQVKDYNKLVVDLKQKWQAFGNDVNHWNSQGGAPPDEYNRLKATQADLQKQTDDLNKLGAKLNQEQETFNNQIGQLNQTVNQFNEALQTRPEEGIYLGGQNRIEIYFNVTKNELLHTIAHEIGHSLGIGHVNDPKGVMYPLTTRTTALATADKEALNSLCRKHNIFEIYYTRLTQIIGVK